MKCGAVAEEDFGATGLSAETIADYERAVLLRRLTSALAVEKDLPVHYGQMRGRRSGIGILRPGDAGQAKHETRADGSEKACHWTNPNSDVGDVPGTLASAFA